MHAGIVGIVLVGVAVALVALVLIARTWPIRPRFTLQWLFVLVALVCLILGVSITWRDWSRARAIWLDPSSHAATMLMGSNSVIEETPVGFRATFRPRYTDIRDILRIPMDWRDAKSGSFGYTVDRQQVEMEATNRGQLQAALDAFNTADALPPKQFVINGVLETQDGTPIANANVDLLGPYVMINHFRTRDDGTFTMPMNAPPDKGYYLRIRYHGGQRMRTSAFKLDLAQRELVVRIQVR